jgi:hypothetical protein
MSISRSAARNSVCLAASGEGLGLWQNRQS